MNDSLRRNPQSPAGLYEQLGNQVRSYHHHYRMGENSSVPTEIARELLESMVYTAQQSPLGTLEAGQMILEDRLRAAKELSTLVRATSPDWESQYRWETAAALERYLQTYDHLHFAHRIPVQLDYPLLLPLPDGLLGLDYGLFYLNCLWFENQILDAMGGAARGSWEEQIPDYWGIPLNLCEQPLIQLLGRQILGLPPTGSDLTAAHRRDLVFLLQRSGKEVLRAGVFQLCQKLHISDPNAVTYACSIADSLYPRLMAALPTGDLSHIFL